MDDPNNYLISRTQRFTFSFRRSAQKLSDWRLGGSKRTGDVATAQKSLRKKNSKVETYIIRRSSAIGNRPCRAQSIRWCCAVCTTSERWQGPGLVYTERYVRTDRYAMPQIREFLLQCDPAEADVTWRRRSRNSNGKSLEVDNKSASRLLYAQPREHPEAFYSVLCYFKYGLWAVTPSCMLLSKQDGTKAHSLNFVLRLYGCARYSTISMTPTRLRTYFRGRRARHRRFEALPGFRISR